MKKTSPTDADFGRMMERLGPLAGQVCTAWRKSYGRTGHLHFGRLLPRAAPPSKAVYTDAGEFVLDLLDCDRDFTIPEEDGPIRSTVDGDDAILERLGVLEGVRVQDVEMDRHDLSIEITFSSGARLRLRTDKKAGSRDEQWALRGPDGHTLVMHGEGHWGIEAPE